MDQYQKQLAELQHAEAERRAQETKQQSEREAAAQRQREEQHKQEAARQAAAEQEKARAQEQARREAEARKAAEAQKKADGERVRRDADAQRKAEAERARLEAQARARADAEKAAQRKLEEDTRKKEAAVLAAAATAPPKPPAPAASSAARGAELFAQAEQARARGNYAEAASLYRKAVNEGSVESQFRLGEAFAAGQGVIQSSLQAYVWFSLAANAGHAGARPRRDQVVTALQPAEIEQADRLIKQHTQAARR